MFRRRLPQPLLGIALATMALLSLDAAWRTPGWASLSGANVALAAALIGGAVAAQRNPIHLSRASKLYLHTIPLFLLAALLAPAVAASGAGLAVLIGELGQRRGKGSLPSDIATTVGRFVVVILISSAIAHLPAPIVSPLTLGGGIALPLGAPLACLPLVGAALALYLGDLLTGALEIGAITGEPPHQVIWMAVAAGGKAELAQYLVGLLGALAVGRDGWAIVLLIAPILMLHGVLKQGLEMHDETRSLLEQMADAVDLRDPSTGGHSRRVAELAASLLTALDIHGPEVELIVSAARVHDIGKIAVPDRILHKPAALTAEERAIMESHAWRGAEFLGRYPDFRRGVAIVLHHHERIDGMGYPHGLRENAIPFGARVIAVVDSFDAMTSDRPYRRGLSVSAAAQALRDGRGRQWDAAMVDAFTRSVIPTLLTGSGAAPADAADRQAAESGRPIGVLA